jgi:sensor domain CHASE-containing protein
MTSYSLGLVPVDFFILLALIVLLIVMLMAWMNEREKCRRLQGAVRELERIQALSTEAVLERSTEKVDQVNDLIGTWDEEHTEEVGEAVPKVTLKRSTKKKLPAGERG